MRYPRRRNVKSMQNSTRFDRLRLSNASGAVF